MDCSLSRRTGGGTGGGSTPQSVFAGAVQTSNIDGAATPQITLDLRVSGGSSGGSATNLTGSPFSNFTLMFQIADPSTTLTHTIVRTDIGTHSSGLATLTRSGQPSINLLLPANFSIALVPGTYTLNVQASGTASGSGFGGGSSFSTSMIGSVTFVPAPGVATALLVPAGIVLARRRRA